jgi:ribosomal lysine N-methyltransferase 2
MEAILKLIDWAKTQDIVLNGISPQAFEGRGIGLIATQKLKEGEVILEVPIRAIKTIETLPRSLTDALPKPPDMTVHGLLALDLALDASKFPQPWRDVLPSREDIATLPLTWDPRLHEHLPHAAKALLEKQKAKFAKDLATCKTAFPDLDDDTYRHAWLLVNSRTFYHTTKRSEKLPKEDHLSLQPVADLFNHAAHGCKVSFCKNSYTITTNRAYARGDEIPICYGRHSNDFLLAEYGFIVGDGTNEWDEVSLDGILLPRLRKSASRKRDLEDAGFWGRYVLDADTICFRTQVAVRSMVADASAWEPYSQGLEDDAPAWKVNDKLREIFEDFEDEIDDTVAKIEALAPGVGEPAQRDTLLRRWEQIRALVRAALARLDEDGSE